LISPPKFFSIDEKLFTPWPRNYRAAKKVISDENSPIDQYTNIWPLKINGIGGYLENSRLTLGD
jgi:hypothetical protein